MKGLNGIYGIDEQNTTLNKLFKTEHRLYHEFALHCGLADAALWVFLAIKEAGKPLTQAEICNLWHVSKQTLNSAVKALIAEGLIELRMGEYNKKNKEVCLTEAGEHFFAENIACLLEAEKAALADLEEHERNILVRLSKKRVDHLKGRLEVLS